MSQQETMTLTEFMKRFGTEEACREYLYEKRWPNGFICPKCGKVDEPFQIISRNLFQCRHCDHQTSVTAGTIMDRTRTPLVKWFLAIYLMSKDKRGYSALQLKKELGIAWNTAWTMSHKIRKAMGERDEEYKLSVTVEIDEGFFGSPSEGEGKRGRGTDKTPVFVGLSLDENGKPEYMKAKVIESVNGETVCKFAEESVEKGSSVSTDGLSVYNQLSSEGYEHNPKNFDPKQNPEHLMWLHIVISNMKAFLNGTYHGVGKKHMQLFLDEFVFRFNRRFWQSQLFGRTVAACMFCPPFTNKQLVMS